MSALLTQNKTHVSKVGTILLNDDVKDINGLCRTDMNLSCPMSGSRLLVMSSTVSRDLVTVSHYCGHHLTYDAAQDKCRGEGIRVICPGTHKSPLSRVAM